MVTKADIDNWFIYHSPTSDQPERYEKIRNKAKELAMIIFESCPDSADRTTAIRKLREAVMTANASIACNE